MRSSWTVHAQHPGGHKNGAPRIISENAVSNLGASEVLCLAFLLNLCVRPLCLSLELFLKFVDAFVASFASSGHGVLAFGFCPSDDYAEFCNWFLLLAPVRSTSPLADLSWTLGAQGAEEIWGRFLHTPDDV